MDINQLMLAAEENQSRLLEVLEETEALFVYSFYNEWCKDRHFLQRRVESILSDRMLDNKAIIFEATEPPKDCTSWTRHFLALVQRHTGEPDYIKRG
jgi:hypothetical protein